MAKPEASASGYKIGTVSKLTGISPDTLRIRERRYNDETLARLAGQSSTIKCECPQHLAELITSLGVFEKYSNECESRSIKDAELHANLGSTASQARHMFENALSLVIEAENIELWWMSRIAARSIRGVSSNNRLTLYRSRQFRSSCNFIRPDSVRAVGTYSTMTRPFIEGCNAQ